MTPSFLEMRGVWYLQHLILGGRVTLLILSKGMKGEMLWMSIQL